MNRLSVVMLGLWSMVAAAPATAQSAAYPVKPVRLLVDQAPGGATDVIARLVNTKLAESMGQTFIVENRTGAAGSIAAVLVSKSAPDGYNLLLVSSSYAINPSLYTDLAFAPVKDLTPVSLIAEAPFLLLVHPSTPARSVKELIVLAKAKPGVLNYGSGGNGSSGHLAGELFTHLAKVKMVHIPYKGAGPALVDVIAGQVHLTFGSVLSSLGHVKNGRLRALGVTSATRSSGAPELPTIAEAGLPGYQTTTWYGLLAPANTPADIVQRLSDEMRKAVNAADVRNRILTDGAEPRGSTPKEFQAHLLAEMKRAAMIIKLAGIKP